VRFWQIEGSGDGEEKIRVKMAGLKLEGKGKNKQSKQRGEEGENAAFFPNKRKGDSETIGWAGRFEIKKKYRPLAGWGGKGNG